jgi:hypothetical protein
LLNPEVVKEIIDNALMWKIISFLNY